MVISAQYKNTEKTAIEVIIEHSTLGEISYGIDLNNVDTELAEQIVEELQDFSIDDYVAPTQTPEEIATANNVQIQAQIDSLEKTLIRPLRELLSTSTSDETKNAAQTKVDEIEAQIETLRSQFVSIGE